MVRRECGGDTLSSDPSMEISPETIVKSSALFLFFALAGIGAVTAQTYPAKPVRVVVPFPGGGLNDVIARILTQKLGENLGVTFVIDNRPGAGGTIGTNIVAKAASDGYTLLFSSSSTIAVSPSMYSKLPYDPVKDFSAIANVASVGSALVVNPALPIKSVKDLIAYAKAHPAQLKFGSAGVGASQHLAAELFKTMAGVDMVHIPYKGGTLALADVIGGQISLTFEPLPTSIAHIRSGRVRALAVTTPKRSPVIPELPTVAESGLPGYDLTIWVGMLAPARTPKEIVQRLSVAILKILHSPEMIERLAGQGAEPIGDTPEHFAAYIKEEIVRWAVIVKASGARAD